MKKLFILIVVLISVSTSYAQRIQNTQSKEIFDLKEIQLQYCGIIIETAGINWNYMVATDHSAFFKFIDDSGEKIKFDTIIELMNFMFKNGWEFIFYKETGLQQLFFKKRPE